VFTIPDQTSTFGVGCQRRSGRGHYATPLPGVGEPLDPGDIWLVVILACTNQNSIWDTCNDTEGTPCDDTVLRWLHTLNRQWLEVVANLLLARLAMTIFDPDRSRTVSIDFIDNPYHGEHHAEKGELCSMAPKDGTTTCHRYCTAYVVSNGKPVTLAMTYVRSDEDEADAVERVLARVENYPFGSISCLPTADSTTSASSAALVISPQRSFTCPRRASA